MASPDRVVAAHEQREDEPWAVEIAEHPRRADSAEYVRSRKAMNAMAALDPAFFYGRPPYDDHHGGGLWLKDEDGWFLVRNLAGMEWSSQFCADVAKVDALRRNAKRLYAGFPGVAEDLGIRELLDTPITDPAGVARWCDSLCNASVPLPASAHTGVLPANGGVHHYPAPVVDIEFFKRDDFTLWVTDDEGNPAAVAPVGHPGSGDGRVHVLWAKPGSALHRQREDAHAAGKAHVLDADHPLAKQAFGGQS
jgi:Family of unknown function (DUF6424)